MKQRDFDEYLEDLEELVNVDSFTGDTRGLNAMAGRTNTSGQVSLLM